MTCFGCFKDHTASGFCKKCRTELFDGVRIHHVLPFDSPAVEQSSLYLDLTKKMSLSGVQIKYSLKLQADELMLTDAGGQYLLKPIPVGQFNLLDQAPANEHLTMQIARQCFRISTPPNALIFFQDQSPAYLVRRFDVRPDGSKSQQEDFAQIAQITEETHGKNYKYDLSYEEVGSLIRQHIPLYQVELEKFFRLVLFNYIFSNGDAHVKNFSAIRTEAGDYVLTPAYDLLCTRIHAPGEADTALDLFKDRFPKAFETNGFYSHDDFLEFGKTLGIKDSRVQNVINEFSLHHDQIFNLIDRSFLNPEIKKMYSDLFIDKVQRMAL